MKKEPLTNEKIIKPSWWLQTCQFDGTIKKKCIVNFKYATELTQERLNIEMRLIQDIISKLTKSFH
jgi:hypothetical protein